MFMIVDLLLCQIYNSYNFAIPTYKHYSINNQPFWTVDNTKEEIGVELVQIENYVGNASINKKKPNYSGLLKRRFED